MHILAIFEFAISIFLMVIAIMIGVPSWLRRTRNLILVREGIQTWGYYQGNNRVTFTLENDTRITFVTWKSAFRSVHPGDKLPVLYLLSNPDRAEVMTPLALWDIPARYLAGTGVLIILAGALILEGVLFIRGMNSTLALIIFILTWPVGSLLPTALYHFYAVSLLLLKSRQRDTSSRQTATKQLPHSMQPGVDAPLQHKEES